MKVAVTYAPHLAQWFSDTAIAVANSFSELGYAVDLMPVKSLAGFSVMNHDLIFVIAPHGYQELGAGFVKNPKKRYVCWDLEQTPYIDFMNDKTLSRFNKTLSYYSNYDFFFTESDAKTAYFIQQGYPAHTLNFGYHPHYTKQVTTEKEYDIYFAGIMFPRRSVIIERLKDAGLTFHPQVGFDPILKAKAVQSSKICLNIHHNDIPYFEKPRIIQDIMANGGFCITETIGYPEGFELDNHFVMSDHYALVSSVVEWIDRDHDRKVIKEKAQSYIKTDYLLTNFLQQAMKVVHG
jgi:hypothetical protein